MVAAGVAAVSLSLAAGALARRPVAEDHGRRVSEREYRIGVYRHTVPPGTIRFNVKNFGEDAHDLEVTTKRGTIKGLSPEIESDGTHTLRVRLTRPGTYRLLCTKLDHAARGMRATIVVKRPQTK